jgi:ABC-type transport system involved in multi-copper enzyme maturation permease subunit
MKGLLNTEWLKLRKYPAFWWMTGIIALSYPGVNYIFYHIYQQVISKGDTTAQMVKMLVGNPFTFPEVWHTVAYASSLFIFIPSVVVIMFITNEYTYKTHRQNIIDGWSRKQFIASKFIDVLLLTALVTVLYLLVALALGVFNNGEPTATIWSGSKYIGLFALQAFSQLSIAFLIAFLVRKAFVSLGIFIFYFIILEPVIVGIAKLKANDLGRFMPLEISDRLIPVPAFLARLGETSYKAALAAINPHIIYTLVMTTLVWVLCFRINSRRDL